MAVINNKESSMSPLRKAGKARKVSMGVRVIGLAVRKKIEQIFYEFPNPLTSQHLPSLPVLGMR
jgi:hypothetical protein